MTSSLLLVVTTFISNDDDGTHDESAEVHNRDVMSRMAIKNMCRQIL